MMDFSYLQGVHWQDNSLNDSTGGKFRFEKSYKVGPLKTTVLSTNTQNYDTGKKKKKKKMFSLVFPIIWEKHAPSWNSKWKSWQEMKKCLIRKIWLSDQLLMLMLGSSLFLLPTCWSRCVKIHFYLQVPADLQPYELMSCKTKTCFVCHVNKSCCYHYLFLCTIHSVRRLFVHQSRCHI